MELVPIVLALGGVCVDKQVGLILVDFDGVVVDAPTVE